jgi:hypothetical protein
LEVVVVVVVVVPFCAHEHPAGWWYDAWFTVPQLEQPPEHEVHDVPHDSQPHDGA